MSDLDGSKLPKEKVAVRRLQTMSKCSFITTLLQQACPWHPRARKMQEHPEPPSFHAVPFFAVLGLLRAHVGGAGMERGEQAVMETNNGRRRRTCLGETEFWCGPE